MAEKMQGGGRVVRWRLRCGGLDQIVEGTNPEEAFVSAVRSILALPPGARPKKGLGTLWSAEDLSMQGRKGSRLLFGPTEVVLRKAGFLIRRPN